MKAFPNPTSNQGMDLRDWFAGLAMQGIVSNSAFSSIEEMIKSSQVAYMIADSMMEIRKEEQ